MRRLRPTTLTPLSDADQAGLVARCVEGEARAREEFLERYARLVYSVIMRILPRTGGDERADVVEDLFGQAFAALFSDGARRLRQWDRKCSLPSWIRVVTASTVFDALRTSARQARFGLGGGADPDQLPAHVPTALEVVVRVEELGRLARALELLGPNDRDLVRMLFAENIAPGEVAERLGIPAGALYTRKNRALERLRAAFLGIDGED